MKLLTNLQNGNVLTQRKAFLWVKNNAAVIVYFTLIAPFLFVLGLYVINHIDAIVASLTSR